MQRTSLKLLLISSCIFLALGVTLAQELGQPSNTVVTDADCENAWAQATASSSCTTRILNAEKAPGSDIVNNCVVKADCASTAGGQHDTFSDYHGGPTGVATLVNCEGILKASSCPSTGSDSDSGGSSGSGSGNDGSGSSGSAGS